MPDTILVLEDDDDIRTVLSDVLRDAGFAAIEADHGRDLPDHSGLGLVLTDLPKTEEGYSSAAAREWVASVRDRYLVPVVIITAHSEATCDDALRSLSAAIVTKPFDLEELVARVKTLAGSVNSNGAR